MRKESNAPAWKRNRESRENYNHGRPSAHELHEARRKVNHIGLQVDQQTVNLSMIVFQLSRGPRTTNPNDPQATQVIDHLDYLRQALDYWELGTQSALLWYQLTNPAKPAKGR